MLPLDYLEKVYAGFLGKCIGIRLGAPVEPSIWNFDRILKTYGYIDRYVKPYKNFAADDDSNGPAYFIRAFTDDAVDRELQPGDVANAWLNYAREGVGMFWWGGYGISTEHTAYTNLKMGLTAPRSGSIAQNGKTIAEQIGGQIFIDTFGLVNPCNAKKAADHGEIAASVSHDGEGLYGARFFCAAISRAFESGDIVDIIEAGLSQIPKESTYYAVARAVMNFYDRHPDDYKLCMEMLKADWGYDKYPGNCHIIPNAGVCVLAMMYGGGDYCKTIEIASTCGWDTDCNAGNVGTVLGVMCGESAFPDKYRKPVNDGIILSGISGYLNILDLPTFAKELALIGYRLAGEAPPEKVLRNYKPGVIHFDFSLPGSTHNIRTSEPYHCDLRHSDELGTGALEILFSQLYRGKSSRIYYKPFYTRDDFSDERYMPAFSPQAYSGQNVGMRLYLDQWEGLDLVGVNPYIRLLDGEEIIIKYLRISQREWTEIGFVIPDTKGRVIDEVGFVLEGLSAPSSRSRGRLFMDDFTIYGKADYTIDMSAQRKDFGNITPFVHSGGAWRIEGDYLSLVRCKPSFSFTGNYYAGNQSITASVIAHSGEDHLLTVRSGGIMRGYAGGFDADGVGIYKNDFGFTKLAGAAFKWEYDREYKLAFTALDDELILLVDGVEVLRVRDSRFASGMAGCGGMGIGRGSYGHFRITEI